MGFFIRKSISFGPIRVNLSKSGLGVSTGVTGARISTGPRGSFVHLGRQGVYYRKKIGGKQRRSSTKKNQQPNNLRNNAQWNAQDVDNYVIEEPIVSYDNLYSEDYISDDEAHVEISGKLKRAKLLRVFWILLLIAAFIFGVYSKYANSLIAVPIVLAIRLIYPLFSVSLKYDMDDELQSEWESFLGAIMSMNSCKTKYGSDSSNLSIKDPLKIRKSRFLSGNKAHIRTNVSYCRIRYGKKEIVVLPDIIVYTKDNKVIAYDDISASSTYASQFEQSISRDMRVEKVTYAHQNKDGSPDLRYKNNPAVGGVVLYDEVDFVLRTGQVLRILLANYGNTEYIATAFNYYARFVISHMEEIRRGSEFAFADNIEDYYEGTFDEQSNLEEYDAFMKDGKDDVTETLGLDENEKDAPKSSGNPLIDELNSNLDIG